MEIKYIGHSCFLIRTKNAKIVTDPFDPKMGGLSPKKLDAAIVTISHQHADHNYLDIIKGNPLVFDMPGEYEKNQVRIYGYPTYHDKTEGSERGENTIFKFEFDNRTILHCGDLGHLLDNQLIEELGDIDVLLLPTGGFYTIGPTEAAQIVNALEPKIVVPMHYYHSKLNQQVFSKLAPVDEFLKQMGVTKENVLELEKLTDSEIQPHTEKQIVILKLHS